MSSDFDAFIQQAAGIAAQVEEQSFNIVFAELTELLFEFLAGVLAKLRDVDVGDAGLKPDGFGDAGAGDRVADDVVADALRVPLARHSHLDLGAAGALQQLGDLSGVEALSLLIVDL